MLLPYTHTPLLVDLPDLVVGATTLKRRARRLKLTLPDSGDQPVVLEPEVIYYQQAADGSYGPEMPPSVCPRYRPRPLQASPLRLVDARTGAIVASRHLPDGTLLDEAAWQAKVAEVEASQVPAMRQNEWFCQMLRQAPVVVDEFLQKFLLLAFASGDLS